MASDKVLVFELLDPSLSQDPAKNITHLKRWNSKEIGDNGVHVFVHPDNAQALKAFSGASIATHVAHEHELKDQWLDIIAKNKNRNKLIIFIKTHGDTISMVGRGNFCYRNEHSCTLDTQKLLEALRALSAMPNSSLKDVLVIPLSCNNKNIMDRFEKEAKKIAWSFNLTILSQANKDICTSNAFGWQLEEQKIMLNSSKHMNDQLVGSVFQAQDIPELLKIYNKIFKLIPTATYEIKKITEAENQLGLEYWGLNNIKLVFRFHCKFLDLNKSLGQMLKDLGIEREASRLSELYFWSSSHKEVKIKIDNLDTIFNKDQFGDDQQNCLATFVFEKNHK